MKTIVIKVDHIDFEMVIGCNNLEATFYKAQRKHSQFLTATFYSINEGRIFIYNVPSRSLAPLVTDSSHPLIFENKEYFVDITFKNKETISTPYIYSRLKAVEERFFYREGPGFLSGVVNFGNDLGQSNLALRYTKENQQREIRFQFEVFPTKLNYRSDYDRIVADIEQQYPYLVLDFLKKTYTFFHTGSSPNTDLIWWQIFGGLYADFIHSVKFILNKPHSRIIKQTRYVKAEQINKWTPAFEETYARFRHLPGKSYYTEYKTLSTDTPENRFFKFAVFQTLRRYKKVKAFIEKYYAQSITHAFAQELQTVAQQLEGILAHPFFRTVGKFQGMKQESLVLQKATGYSTIYRSWIMLNSGLRFLEGIQQIELKNIAQLYQIWCFIEMKNILQHLLGKAHPDDVELAPIQTTDDFVSAIERGVRSKVSFSKADGTVIDLYHDFSYDTTDDQAVRSFTVDQQPDIVLNITKNDLKEQYVLTYLFDAKYRLASDEKEGGADLPTTDAINQMHRYRDAIYYVDKSRARPEKEIIGAYVLFPGTGDIEAIKKLDYYTAVAHVNIGAFPLSPNDFTNRSLLEAHLRTIIVLDTAAILNDIAPQKETVYESPNPDVLIGFVRSADHALCFEQGDKPFYFSGPDKPAGFGFKNLKYFAPYIKGNGIKDYYEILSYDVIPRNQIPNAPGGDPNDHSERLVIWLGRKSEIAQGAYLKINGPIGRVPYRYTNLKNIRTPMDNKIAIFSEK